MINEVSEEARVKNESIFDSKLIFETKTAKQLKEEPIDIEIQKSSNSHIESRLGMLTIPP